MLITSVNDLRKFLSHCTKLRHVLCAFSGYNTLQDTIDEFYDQDYFVVFGDDLHMCEGEAREWVIDNWESPVDCEVIEEEGPNGGWPVVSVKCAGKQLLLDWVYDWA